VRIRLRRLAALFVVVGVVLVIVVVATALVLSANAAEEEGMRVFFLTLLWGMVAVLPYIAFAAILEALAVLVPPDARPVPARRPVALESPGVTLDEVLDGPGSMALERRILGDLLAVGDITRAEYDDALADPRLTGSPTH